MKILMLLMLLLVAYGEGAKAYITEIPEGKIIVLESKAPLRSAQAEELQTQEPNEIVMGEGPVIESDPILPITRYMDFIEWADIPNLLGTFTTDNKYNGNLGGVSGAHDKCIAEARTKGYLFPEQAKAFVFLFRERLENFAPANAIMIRLSDNQKIAKYDDFIRGRNIKNTLNTLSERYNKVWSGAMLGSSNRMGSIVNCNSWTSITSGSGSLIRADRIVNSVRYTNNCNRKYRLLCFMPMDIFPESQLGR